MAVIAIPVLTGYALASPEFIDFDVALTPPMGGVEQTLQRLGSRWAVSVQLPPAREGVDFRDLMSALVMARREGASYPFPQPGSANTLASAPTIAGAGQLGSVLNLANVNNTVQFKRGQFISVTNSVRRYLYMITADTVWNGFGGAALPIFPMLRASPTNGSDVECNLPLIEGKITTQMTWDHDVHEWVPLSFRIAEVA